MTLAGELRYLVKMLREGRFTKFERGLMAYRLWVKFWCSIRAPWWAWKNAYQVSMAAENPWKHGGRRGKSRPEVHRFACPNNRFDYRILRMQGWRHCSSSPMARLRRWVAA